MISVCMATYNGEKFIREQIASILPQLNLEDELIISDDNSSDDTVEIIRSFKDARIQLLHHSPCGVAWNFENALKQAKGEYIFLADQDDVWLPGKVDAVMKEFRNGNYDLITTNCTVTDSQLNVIQEKFYTEKAPLSFSFTRNFVSNRFLGSCYAFNRRVYNAVMPFPRKVVMHDTWITLYSLLNFSCGYINDSYMLYRRLKDTVSFLGKKNTHSLYFKLAYRGRLLMQLLSRTIMNQWK